MKVTRAFDYKLFILFGLAKKEDELVSLRDIAKEHALPLPFLRALAREMVQDGLIIGKEGKGGGYRLTKPAKSISLADLFSKEGILSDLPCLQEQACGRNKTCKVAAVWVEAERAIYQTFKQITLSDMVAGPIKFANLPKLVNA